jgi:hypothetical protein
MLVYLQAVMPVTALVHLLRERAIIPGLVA